MTEEMQCEVVECHFKTPPMELAMAMQRLALHDKQVHSGAQVVLQQQPQGHQVKAKPDKVRRPELKKGISEDKYLHYHRQWVRYKRATGLVGEEAIRDQLLSSCSEELAEDMENLYGEQLDTKTESELLSRMHQLAVVAQNHLVNVVRLRSMVQDNDESIRSYLSRLKGAANVCNLTVSCTCQTSSTVSYADQEILHCLVKGLADEDIRRQVLGVVDVMDLDTTVKFIEAKESGRKAGAFLDSSEVGLNKMTSYRQVQKQNLVDTRAKPDELKEEARCKYCNRKGHGAKPGLSVKREKCPAFDKTCNKCGGLGHFAVTKSCRDRPVKIENVKVQYEQEDRSQVGVKSVGVEVDSKGQIVRLSPGRPVPHMQEEDGQMKVTMPKDHPKVRVQVQVNTEMYEKTGLPLEMGRSFMTKKGKLLQIPNVDLLCDTGAQVDCMNRKQLKALGLVESQLLRPEVVVGCANESKANVLGVFFGRVIAMEEKVKVKVQVLFYVLKDGGSILSKHTCGKLGLISQDFPKIGEHLLGPVEQNEGLQVNEVKEQRSEELFQEKGVCDPDSRKPCRCPRREYVDPPTHLPFPADEENREKLENWIINYYASSAFLSCKRQEMPCTEGPPMKIHLKPDAVPVAIHKPVPVPLHFREEVSANIEADVKRGVLRKVPPGEPTPWCAKLVITAKKDGRPRRTVDLAELTRAGIRETHHTRSPIKVVCSVPSGMVKTTLDCVDGYHGIPLAQEDWHKTTFLTEKGRFQYMRAPQGYGSSNDGYTIRTDEVLTSVPGRPEVVDYEKIVDDVITWSPDIETAFFRVCNILSHCAKSGMVFSAPKFVFGAKEVEYAGFLVGVDSIQPTPKYVQSILDFPTPKNISDIRSWFGLINQVAYAFAKGTIMAPFRELLKPAIKFEWTPELNKAFESSKLEIVRLVKAGVKMFDTELITCLSTDFCKTGLGWILQQKTCECQVISPICCNGGWRLVLAGGRFTIPAESRYSPTEGEALAVAVGLECSKYYTLGCKKLVVATDHKPLLSILNDRALDTIVNPRILRLKERTLAWQFDMVYVPGGRQAAADALSRKKANVAVLSAWSVCDMEHMDMESRLQAEVSINLVEVFGSEKSQVGVMTADAEPKLVTWQELQEATNNDEVLVKLREEIQRGMADSMHEVPAELKEFHRYRHGLLVVDGVIMYKQRLVVPGSLQKRMLETLHAAHQGVSGMVNRAEQSIFWPSITTDITRTRAMCRTCVRNSPSQPAGKPVRPPSPSYPFQLVVADYCHMNGVNYLVIADRYSGWLSVLYVGKGEFDTDKLIDVFRDYFLSFGVVEEISSDSASQFMSAKFQKFLRQYGVRQRLSSSYFPHSNSRAELGVKSGKRILMDNMSSDGKVNTDKFLRAMLQYRNTPQPDTRMSPAQIVFGRYLRDFIPVVNNKYEPKQEWAMIKEYRERALARRLDRDGAILERYTKKLDTVPIGHAVAVQNQKGRFPKKWDKTGVVVENMDHDKVLVRMDGSRRLTTRNRRFVKKIISPQDLPDQNVMQDPSTPVVLGAADDEVAKAQGDIEDMDGMCGVVQQQGMGQDETVAADSGIPDEEPSHRDDQSEIGLAEDRVNSQPRSPGRPQRTRKPNVKYSQEEYDLSTVSAHIKQAGLYGISVRQFSMKDRQLWWSPESCG